MDARAIPNGKTQGLGYPTFKIKILYHTLTYLADVLQMSRCEFLSFLAAENCEVVEEIGADQRVLARASDLRTYALAQETGQERFTDLQMSKDAAGIYHDLSWRPFVTYAAKGFFGRISRVYILHSSAVSRICPRLLQIFHRAQRFYVSLG